MQNVSKLFKLNNRDPEEKVEGLGQRFQYNGYFLRFS